MEMFGILGSGKNNQIRSLGFHWFITEETRKSDLILIRITRRKLK